MYVDGFNFYYAAFRRGRFQDHKWLDPAAFCRAALPRNDTGKLPRAALRQLYTEREKKTG